jgi:hypothetical protein
MTAPNVCIAKPHESLTWDDSKFGFDYIDGRRWRLQHDFRFHYEFDGRHFDGCVPAGFVFDFHSVPRLLWVIFHPSEYGQAAAVHDYLYRTKGLGVSRGFADEIYLASLTKCGAGEKKRKAMYRGVRLFGWASFKADDE